MPVDAKQGITSGKCSFNDDNDAYEFAGVAGNAFIDIINWSNLFIQQIALPAMM